MVKGSPVETDQIQDFRRDSEAFLQAAGESDYAIALRELKIAELSSVADLSFSWGKWQLVFDQPSKVEAQQIEQETHLLPVVKKFMDGTNCELIIVSPYFVPGTWFTSYLAALVNDGTRVRIGTNSLAANDVPLVHAGYIRYRKDLVEGGVELYEFKPRKDLSPQRHNTRGKWSGSSRASLHGKYMGFDRRYMFVGSFNLDARSAELNTELGVFFESPEAAEKLAEAFDQSAMKKGYRVIVTEEGDLQWVTLENGAEKRFDVEPETGFWTRFGTRALSIIVPESQL